MSRKDKKSMRLGLTRAAARKLRKSVRTFCQAITGTRVNLNHIPEPVVQEARALLRPRFRSKKKLHNRRPVYVRIARFR